MTRFSVIILLQISMSLLGFSLAINSQPGLMSNSWQPMGGKPGFSLTSDGSFEDVSGCSNLNSVSYLRYSERFRKNECASVASFAGTYIPNNKTTKVNFSMAPVTTYQFDSLETSKELNFSYSMIQENGMVVLFGIPERFTKKEDFYLVIKAENLCGKLILDTPNNAAGKQIAISSDTCAAETKAFAYYPETCHHSNATKKANITGRCVANAVVTSPSGIPLAKCFHNMDRPYIGPGSFCACKAGYEPDDQRPDQCFKCRPQTYKASVGNMRCSRCPRGSMYDEETTERCKCELGLFRLKGDPIGPCNRPRKPLKVILKRDYTWANISIPRDDIQDDVPYVAYVYEKKEYPQSLPTVSKYISRSRPEVMIRDLKPHTEMLVFVCDTRELDYSPIMNPNYDRNPSFEEDRFHNVFISSKSEGDWKAYGCEKSEFKTSEDISIRDLSIDPVGSPTSPKLLVQWSRPEALEKADHSFRYLVDIICDGNSIWMSTVDATQTSLEYPVSTIEGTYRADVRLELNGMELSRLSSKTITINSETSTANMSTLLVTVVGLILVILFVVFLLAVIFLRARRDNIFPPPIPGSKSHHATLNMFNYDPITNVTTNTYDSEKWGTLCFDQSPAAIRFMEPETELLPLYESRNKSWQDLFSALEIVHIPISDLDTEKLQHSQMLSKGQFEVCKVRSKDNSNNYDQLQQAQLDLKFCPTAEEHPQGRGSAYRALVIEAATLAQLKHNHVVLMHGVVEYCTEQSVQLALLLEDCGSMTLQQYCSASGVHQPGIMEKLQHLRAIATALEHFSQLQYVHKVLKADNILINPNGVCRVAGFEDRVEFNKAPEEMLQKYLRFWPPEVVKGRLWSLGTDIWSFGVVIWQCFNPTEFPFQQYTDAQVEKFVMEGLSLSPNPSDMIPPKLSEVMKACFAYNSVHRPTAFDLKEIIHSILFPTRSPDYSYNVDYNTIRFLLEQNKMSKYAELFELVGVDRIEQLQWTDAYLKNLGIHEKKHRRKLITEASKVLHGKAVSPV